MCPFLGLAPSGAGGREAPPASGFALLGPREVGQEGFRDGKVIETALKSIAAIAEELEAKTAVFVAPRSSRPPAPTRAWCASSWWG